jgi:hypothetical protein
MQHSAVDLENYARLYTEDRLREAVRRQRADTAVTGESLLGRVVAHVQSWFSPVPVKHRTHAPVAPQPVQLVPMAKKPRAASADPYAGMIVLVRGPRADAA